MIQITDKKVFNFSIRVFIKKDLFLNSVNVFPLPMTKILV